LRWVEVFEQTFGEGVAVNEFGLDEGGLQRGSIGGYQPAVMSG